MSNKHIIAASGGFTRTGGNPFETVFGPIVRYGLELTGKERPKFCYIGTATGDSDTGIRAFYGACIGENVEPSHLQLFSMPNVENVRDHILSQDMIWVQGGSVVNLLAVWRAHGLDAIVREAWEQGIVLAGISAGSICWHTGGTTDSFGTGLQPVTTGLGILPFSNGVHYDTELQRRPLFQKLIGEGTLGEGYATDDGTAIHYIDTQFHKAICDTDGKYAYHVAKTADGVQETQLETTLLT